MILNLNDVSTLLKMYTRQVLHMFTREERKKVYEIWDTVNDFQPKDKSQYFFIDTIRETMNRFETMMLSYPPKTDTYVVKDAVDRVLLAKVSTEAQRVGLAIIDYCYLIVDALNRKK